MNFLNNNNMELSFSAPSGGLWTAQSGAGWSGWTQFAPALHSGADEALRIPRARARRRPVAAEGNGGGCDRAAA